MFGVMSRKEVRQPLQRTVATCFHNIFFFASTTFAHLEIMIVDACDCDGDLRYVKTRSRLDDSHRGASKNAT